MKSKLLAVAALALLAAAIIVNIQTADKTAVAAATEEAIEESAVATIVKDEVYSSDQNTEVTTVITEEEAEQELLKAQAIADQKAEAFAAMADVFFKEIPKVNSLKNLTEADVHNTPAIVLEAGQYLAEAREFFVKNPQPADVEMKFYMKCANDSDLFDSIRAVCAARSQRQFKILTGQEMSPHVFESRIARLSQMVDL